MNCENDSDVFSMEEFADMEPKEIIKVGQYCYNIVSLYNWIINQRKPNDPYTGLPFTREQKLYVHNTAKQRYPLKIKFIIIGDIEKPSLPSFYDTTSLQSIEGLSLQLAKAANVENVTSNYQFIQRTLGKAYFTLVSPPIPNSPDECRELIELLNKHAGKSLFELGIKDNVGIVSESVLEPRDELAHLTHALDICARNEWPIEPFEIRIHQLVDEL